MEIPYTLVRSKRKTVSVEIGADASVTVRVPDRMSVSEVERFLAEKEAWIKKNRRKMLNRLEETPMLPPFTEEELRAFYRKAKVLVPERVRYFAPIMGVTYNRISIRRQHTRWGSCSSQGNLSFNCLLAAVPSEVLDYIVVHELAHRIEMNHSKRFYELVARVIPDYREREKYLKAEGAALIRRL